MSKYMGIERMAELRKRQGLTLGEVAKKMGSHPPDVSRLENGLDVTTPEYLERYARAIAVPARVVRRFYWAEVEAYGWKLIKLAKSRQPRASRGEKQP